MLPLKFRRSWTEEKRDAENNALVVTIKKTNDSVSSTSPVIEETCVIEISSPYKDRLGRQSSKRRRFSVTPAFLADMRQAMHEIERLEKPRLIPNNGTLQIFHEIAAGFRIIYEVPPFKEGGEPQTRYVIGNGNDLRFIAGNYEGLQHLHSHLQNVFL